jgi:hypothetical protein
MTTDTSEKGLETDLRRNDREPVRFGEARTC